LTSDVIAFESDIDRRTGWPDELCVLLKEYPRESWPQTATPLAQFWIDRHNYFRKESEALRSATGDYREQRILPSELADRVVYRLQTCLSHLNGHHQLEDHHYFPAFRAADRRLGAGFDVLAQDHELLHEGIGLIAERIRTFSGTVDGSDDQRHAADEFTDAGQTLCRRLHRHLDDEEDLIIPILLANGR
jgi:hemerythrin-like domain-containing protein